MSNDLYDSAKPIRDAAWAEALRCIGDVDLGPTIIEGHKLGTHLQALCIAFCARRYKDFQPRAIADDLLEVYAIAIGQAAAHMAGSCRPMVGGAPAKPHAVGAGLHPEARGSLLSAACSSGAWAAGFQHSVPAQG